MYYNSKGERISRAQWNGVQHALKNRLELVKAGFTRRDLMKMGLMTGAGVLLAKGGLTHAQTASSSFSGGCFCGRNVGCRPQPPAPFIDPMPIPPQLQTRPLTDPGVTFGAPPQLCPNNAPNPNNGNLPFDGRGQFNGSLIAGADCLQLFNQYPPQQEFVKPTLAHA